MTASLIVNKKTDLLPSFTSPFFTLHMAACHSHHHTSDPAVQYYLCQRLRDATDHLDVQSLLPQSCHLMIMKNGIGQSGDEEGEKWQEWSMITNDT